MLSLFCPYTKFLYHLIISAIQHGYKLELDAEPPPSMVAKNRLARERPEFVKTELDRLKKLGCIVKVDQKPRVVNPMSVVCEYRLAVWFFQEFCIHCFRL